MGKAVFLNFPTHGCINSILGTVSELVNRGQKIIYYCTEEFRNKIEQTGAEFRPYKGVVNTFKIELQNLLRLQQLYLLQKIHSHLLLIFCKIVHIYNQAF